MSAQRDVLLLNGNLNEAVFNRLSLIFYFRFHFDHFKMLIFDNISSIPSERFHELTFAFQRPKPPVFRRRRPIGHSTGMRWPGHSTRKPRSSSSTTPTIRSGRLEFGMNFEKYTDTWIVDKPSLLLYCKYWKVWHIFYISFICHLEGTILVLLSFTMMQMIMIYYRRVTILCL